MNFEQHVRERMTWRYFLPRLGLVAIGLAGAWALMVMMPN